MLTIYNLNKDLIYEIQKYLSTKKLILFSRTCKQLREIFKDNLCRLSLDLSIYNYSTVTDVGLEYLKGVHTINLCCCYNITDAGLQHLQGDFDPSCEASSSPLKTNFSSEKQVYRGDFDPSCEASSSSLKTNFSSEKQVYRGVHTIDLHVCNKITDKGLKYLKGVNKITLSACNKITDTGLKNIKEAHYVNLSYCKRITTYGHLILREANPIVDIVHDVIFPGGL